MKKTLVSLAAAALLALAGCSTSTDAESSPTETDATAQATASEQEAEPAADMSDAVVFAAASLTEVFPLIAPDATYSFGGSSGLVDQLVGGAPADVFASANLTNMDRAVDEGVIVGEPVLFATNYLVLVVPDGNPAGVTGFDDSLDGVKLVVCAEDVPCGAATVRAAEDNNLTLNPVSEETSVTDVLGKVTSGEADAGLVYLTDASRAGDDVEVLEVPGAADDPNTYWLAIVEGAANPEAAQAFIDAVTGPAGAQVLAEYGFGPAE